LRGANPKSELYAEEAAFRGALAAAARGGPPHGLTKEEIETQKEISRAFSDSSFSLTAAQLAVVKRLWRRLKAEAETAQAKAVAVRDQSSRVWAELMDSQNAEQAMREASARQASRIAELERLLAGDFSSGGHELEEVEAAEETLKAALAKVSMEKERLIKERLHGDREQRTCVICQEEEKTTLLMPCRHLCLCGGCAARPELENCPLCRAPIESRISVYA